MSIKTLWNKETLIEKCKEKHVTGLSGLNKPQLWEAYITHCTLADLNHLCQEFHWTGHSHFNKAQLLEYVRERINHFEENKGSHEECGSDVHKAPRSKKSHSSTKAPTHHESDDDDDDDFDDFMMLDDGADHKHKATGSSGTKKPTPHKAKTNDDDGDKGNTASAAKPAAAPKGHKSHKEKIPDDVRRSCFKIVFGDKLQGKCPVCKFGAIAFDKGQFQAAHIKAEAKGGETIADNLVPSCGCNQIMGTTNLFDYMGSRIELRSNLWELACCYWVACTPRAQMEKELKRLGKKFVLVEFLKVKYQPVDLEKYKDWLEIPESWSSASVLL